MVFIKVEEKELRYHIWEISRLFYGEDEIIQDQEEPPEGYQGVFIFGWFDKGSSGCFFRVEVRRSISCYNEEIPADLNESAEDSLKSRKQFKWTLKRAVYIGISKVTDKELQWGMLTGIRPAKIVREMLEQGDGKGNILKSLTQYYFVSGQKADILYDVACTERSILAQSGPEMVGVYIGIPFCPTRCLYCSFTSNSISKYGHMVDLYLTALKREIEGVCKIIEDKKFKIESIYIGGGTPTSLSCTQLKDLLKFIGENLNLHNIKEFTVEAGRPDSLDREKLEVVKNSKVDRISINPQTMNDDTLKLIGRSHTAQDIVNAFTIARETGIGNINMDIIVGLPGEDKEIFCNTLKQIGDLNPESLTVHTLAVKRASILSENRNKYSLVSSEQASNMIDIAREYTGSMGMHPYYLYRQKNMLGNLENIGYCKPGFESIYNIQIMEERQTIIALGAGAVTKVVYPEDNRLERAFNVKGVEEYIGRVDEMLERKKLLLSEK